MAEHLNMVSVKSSNVQAVGYDGARNELHVQYKSGGHYVYVGVRADLYQRALGAESVGSFLHKHVKGKYAQRKH